MDILDDAEKIKNHTETMEPGWDSYWDDLYEAACAVLDAVELKYDYHTIDRVISKQEKTSEEFWALVQNAPDYIKFDLQMIGVDEAEYHDNN